MNFKNPIYNFKCCVYLKLDLVYQNKFVFSFFPQQAKNKFNAKQAKQAELEYCRLTEALVAEKEKEFQDYAREVIELESDSTNKCIYPLVKAVQEGPGGGRRPVLMGRGGFGPSYQANDSTGVQLPFYNSQGSKCNFQKSKGKLGFTW